MVAKKDAGEEFKRINITLDPALFDNVKARLTIEGNSLSGIIARLLTSWMNEEQEQEKGTITPSPVNTTSDFLQVIDQMKEEITGLRNEVLNLKEKEKHPVKEKQVTLIHTDTHQCIPEPAPEIITQKAGIVVSPVTPMEVSPEPITVNSVPGKVTSDEVKIIGQGLIAFRQKTGMDVKKQMREYFGCDISHMKKWSEGDNAKAPGRDKYNMIMSKLKEAGVI